MLGLKFCDFFYFPFYRVIPGYGLVKLTLVDLSFFSIFVFILLRSFLLGLFFVKKNIFLSLSHITIHEQVKLTWFDLFFFNIFLNYFVLNFII